MNYLIQGLMIGLIIGIPLEQAAEMLVQNASGHGIMSGIASGFGASFAYFIFASVSALIVSLLSKYILRAEPVLGYIFAGIFIIIGSYAILKKEDNFDTDNSNSSNFMNAMNGFMLGFTNKFAFFSIIYLYLYFGIRHMKLTEGVILAASTATGAFLWWFVIAFFANVLGKIKEIKNIKIYKTLSNLFVIIVGIMIIITKLM